MNLKLKFKPDFSKAKSETPYGIMMLNGKHLGISWYESDDGQSNIVEVRCDEDELQQLFAPLTYDRKTLKRVNDYTYAHCV